MHFAKHYKETVKLPEIEAFWDLQLDHGGQALAERIAALARELQALAPAVDHVVQHAMPVCAQLTRKREVYLCL